MEFNNLTRQEFKGAVIGMILGDGSLVNRKNSSFKSSSVIKSCTEMKNKIISQLTQTTIYKDESRKNSYGHKPLYELRSRIHPVYTKLRKRFYYLNRKTIDHYIMSTLNELGILFWYLDDGCLDDSCGLKFQLHTSNFNYIENYYLQKMLNDRFELRFNIRKSVKNERIYYWLYLKSADRLKFYDQVISPFIEQIPQEIIYKIPQREYLEKLMASPSHRRFYEDIV